MKILLPRFRFRILNSAFCILLTAFIISYSEFCTAQNLVPNGDFEVGPDSSSAGWIYWPDSTCGAIAIVNGPDFWVATKGSPDRLVEGTIFTQCLYDNDTAQSGSAYIMMYYNNEDGKTTLLAPMQKDSLYRLSYYHSLETAGGTQFQPHRIAIKFNNGGDSLVSPYAITAQWQYYDTVFTASANSTEIEILSIEPVGSGTKIDNISLEKIPATGIYSVQNDKLRIIIFPNPAKDFVNVTVKNNSFLSASIYNSNGRKILTENVKTSFDTYQIDLSALPNGFYIVQFYTKNGKQITEKFIKQK